MPRFRVEVRATAEVYQEIEVWAEDEEEAKIQAEKLGEDEVEFSSWDDIDAWSCEQVEPEPEDPDCPEDRRMRAMGMPELPGIAA